MLLSPQFGRELIDADSAPSAEAVREQLRSLLAHPLFTNSKRYPVLLGYAVEQALLGNARDLKERTIGVEAFGREPNYDVGLDPVVRSTAAEVRKRLTQYYYNPDHAGELVIELPVGSYVPSFRPPAHHHAALTTTGAFAFKVELPARESVGSPVVLAASTSPHSNLTRRQWSLIILALLVAASIGFGIARIKPFSFAGESSNLERFWAPVAGSASRVTYCLGEPESAIDRENRALDVLPEYASLNVSDVTTLARSVVPLVSRNSSFRVVASSHASFAQLREGPVVLIGAFDNVWTMRITQNLPIGFESDHQFRKVVDRKGPQKRLWAIDGQLPETKLAQDYAIVARIRDNITGQPVIILAGIWGEGTEAASEVVSNPVALNAMLKKAPKGWDHMNLEAVIETQLIDGHPGPPSVLAVEAW